MTTQAKTLKAPSNEGTHAILAFNKEGQIDVFLFKDTTEMAKMLGMDVSRQIPLTDLANANILYQISQQLRLVPGETKENDEQIIAFLSKKISDNIVNKDTVVAEIIASWNMVANLDISLKYANFKQNKNQTKLKFQGAYELTLREYITSYISTINEHKKIPNWVLTQAAEVLESTRDGRAFSSCPYERMDALIRLAEECKSDIKSSTQTIDAIKSNLERENGKWFTDLSGLIGFEIEIAVEEAKEAEDLAQKSEKKGEAEEARAKLEKIRTTLQCLLNGQYSLIPKDEAIEGLFEQSIKLLRNPLSADFHKGLTEKPSAEQMTVAIKYIINKKLKEQQLLLTSKKVVDPILALADSQDEESAESLVNQLLDEKNHFSVGTLNSILNRTKNQTVREIVSARLGTIPSLSATPTKPIEIPNPQIAESINLIKLACSSSERAIELLLSHLLDDTNYIPRSVLRTIFEKTNVGSVRDVVSMKLESDQDSFQHRDTTNFIPHFGPVTTTQFDHMRKRKTEENTSNDLENKPREGEQAKEKREKKDVISLL